MANLTFTCNSFRFIYYLKFKIYFFFFNRKKIRKKFVKGISLFFNVKPEQVFLFGAARMGLYTLLKSLNLKKDDEVIVCGYTCVVVTNTIKYCGAKAVYADINTSDLNFDEQSMYKLVNNQTRAIIVPHNFGVVSENISKFKADFPSVILIEDAAHTFGSVNKKGVKAGVLGDASFFSFEYSKPITTGMGGALLVNNEKLLNSISEYYNQVPEANFRTTFKIIISLFLHYFTSFCVLYKIKGYVFGLFRRIGLVYVTQKDELNGEIPKNYPVKLSPYLCLIGLFQLQDIEKINKKKKSIAEYYSFVFSGINGIKLYYKEGYDFVRFPIVFTENISLATIKEIKADLIANKYLVGDWFNNVVHPDGSYRYCYESGVCPVGEDISERIINLPINISKKLSQKEIITIAGIIKNRLI
jgi:perosamine synthetase